MTANPPTQTTCTRTPSSTHPHGTHVQNPKRPRASSLEPRTSSAQHERNLSFRYPGIHPTKGAVFYVSFRMFCPGSPLTRSAKRKLVAVWTRSTRSYRNPSVVRPVPPTAACNGACAAQHAMGACWGTLGLGLGLFAVPRHPACSVRRPAGFAFVCAVPRHGVCTHTHTHTHTRARARTHGLKQVESRTRLIRPMVRLTKIRRLEDGPTACSSRAHASTAADALNSEHAPTCRTRDTRGRARGQHTVSTWSASGQHVVSTSSAHRQGVASMRTTHHQYVVSMQPTRRQHAVNTPSAQGQDVLGGCKPSPRASGTGWTTGTVHPHAR